MPPLGDRGKRVWKDLLLSPTFRKELKMINSEWDLIKRIKKIAETGNPLPGLVKGIGDDCAVYRISEKKYGLFSTDISVNNIHFNTSFCSWRDIGYKAVAANISDILAMGGSPILALSALVIPDSMEDEDIDELYLGMTECAGKFNTVIAGGDISRGSEPAISISIYGETENPVYRSGAQAGDYLYITGDTGRSRGGLEIMQERLSPDQFPGLIKKHLRPSPAENYKTVIDTFTPNAMIDISDGIISDIKHICAESNKGFKINCDSLPVHKELKNYCAKRGRDHIEYALSSGEEYELLFTSAKMIDNIEGISLIGEITDCGEVYFRSGKEWVPMIKGYEHFKNKEK